MLVKYLLQTSFSFSSSLRDCAKSTLPPILVGVVSCDFVDRSPPRKHDPRNHTKQHEQSSGRMRVTSFRWRDKLPKTSFPISNCRLPIFKTIGIDRFRSSTEICDI